MIRVPTVDAFLRDGCGRCDKFKTPACKVRTWERELVTLRALVRRTGMTEEVKWGFPCYSLDRKNVVMIVAFKDNCALSFLKGAALVDDDGVLEAAGPNSRHGRFLRFRSMAEIEKHEGAAARLLAQAVAFTRAGKKLEMPPPSEPIPAELENRLAKDRRLKAAFEALTPGRQRSHILHIGGAKQESTRERRVDKCAELIALGKGFNER